MPFTLSIHVTGRPFRKTFYSLQKRRGGLLRRRIYDTCHAPWHHSTRSGKLLSHRCLRERSLCIERKKQDFQLQICKKVFLPHQVIPPTGTNWFLFLVIFPYAFFAQSTEKLCKENCLFWHLLSIVIFLRPTFAKKWLYFSYFLINFSWVVALTSWINVIRVLSISYAKQS